MNTPTTDSLTLPAINSNRNIPVWLTHTEAVDLLSRMEGTARLMAELLYGTGSRITALLTLRLIAPPATPADVKYYKLTDDGRHAVRILLDK